MNNGNGNQVVKDVYALIGELWCSPPEVDTEKAKTKKDADRVLAGLETVDKEVIRLTPTTAASRSDHIASMMYRSISLMSMIGRI